MDARLRRRAAHRRYRRHGRHGRGGEGGRGAYRRVISAPGAFSRDAPCCTASPPPAGRRRRSPPWRRSAGCRRRRHGPRRRPCRATNAAFWWSAAASPGWSRRWRCSGPAGPCGCWKRRPRAGGRCMTLRGGDTVRGERRRRPSAVGWDAAPHLYFNPGPARIPHHHRGILGYCKALGVPLEVLVNENRAALRRCLRPVRCRCGGCRPICAAWSRNSPPRGWSAARLAAPLGEADLEALRAMLRRFGALEADQRYRGSSRAGWAEPPGGRAGAARRRCRRSIPGCCWSPALGWRPASPRASTTPPPCCSRWAAWTASPPPSPRHWAMRWSLGAEVLSRCAASTPAPGSPGGRRRRGARGSRRRRSC